MDPLNQQQMSTEKGCKNKSKRVYLGSTIDGRHKAGQSSAGSELEDSLVVGVFWVRVHPVGKDLGRIPEMVTPERMGSDEAQLDLVRGLCGIGSDKDLECGLWWWGAKVLWLGKHAAHLALGGG